MSLSEVAPADTHRCGDLCARVSRCNVPIFWGMKACLEYCASGNYERTFGCLESATKTGCPVERIEACIHPCD